MKKTISLQLSGGEVSLISYELRDIVRTPAQSTLH